jgi:hypothetical protein
LIHIEPVVRLLERDSRVNITVLCPDTYSPIKFYQARLCALDIDDFGKTQAIDIFISTEVIDAPYYVAGTSIFFGHGIGPKLDYQLGILSKNIDLIFCPCTYFYKRFLEFLPNSRLRNIGLPILDEKPVENGKRFILYAPSRNADLKYTSDYNSVISVLTKLTNYEVIVSMHPLLTKNIAERVLPAVIDIRGCPHICMLEDTQFANTFDALRQSILVVSDISSILFEALAFETPVVFDGNIAVYEKSDASDLVNDLNDFAYTLAEISSNDSVREVITQDPRRDARKKFADSYLANLDSAAQSFVNELYGLV